jgi:hypothetical protein
VKKEWKSIDNLCDIVRWKKLLMMLCGEIKRDFVSIMLFVLIRLVSMQSGEFCLWEVCAVCVVRDVVYVCIVDVLVV